MDSLGMIISKVFVFPGILQPLNVFEPQFLSLINDLIDGDIEGSNQSFLMVPPSDELPLIGTVVTIEKIIENLQQKKVILVKGATRARVRERFDSKRGYEMAKVEYFEDHPPENIDELQRATQKLTRLIRRINERYESNSLWKVITQLAGPVPENDPVLLSFWAISCLPPSVNKKVKASWLRSQSTLQRLRFSLASSFFTNPSLSSNRDETSAFDQESLIQQCIESICDNFNDPMISQMAYLPPSLLDKIVAYLRKIDKMNLQTLESLKQCKIQTLNLSSLPKLNDQWIQVLSNYKSLVFLDLSFAYTITDPYLSECFKNMPQLRTVILDGCKRIGDVGVANLRHCRHLSYIRLNGTRITNLTIQVLRSLPLLTHLSISGTLFSNEGIYFLVGVDPEDAKKQQIADELNAKNQENFEIEISENVEDSTLQSESPPKKEKIEKEEEIENFSKNIPLAPPPPPPEKVDSETLNLNEMKMEYPEIKGPLPLVVFHCGETRINSIGCKYLEKLTTLTELNISFNQRITNWKFLSSLKNLTLLDLSLNPNFGDEHARSLQTLINLTSLNLSKTELTDEGLPSLFKLSNLIFLNLSATSVSDYVRSGFPYWQKLETLYLNYTNITSDLVLSFKELPQLIALKMTGCWNFLDDGLKLLFDPSFQQLEYLDVGHKYITDAALANVGVLSNLKVFNLWNTKVTDQGAELVKSLTGLVLDETMNTSRGTFLFMKKANRLEPI